MQAITAYLAPHNNSGLWAKCHIIGLLYLWANSINLLSQQGASWGRLIYCL